VHWCILGSSALLELSKYVAKVSEYWRRFGVYQSFVAKSVGAKQVINFTRTAHTDFLVRCHALTKLVITAGTISWRMSKSSLSLSGQGATIVPNYVCWTPCNLTKKRTPLPVFRPQNLEHQSSRRRRGQSLPLHALVRGRGPALLK
jgi:hypothetical protein